MKINNSLDVARWEKTICSCNHDDVEKCYPIHNCIHCKCKNQWKSVPKEDFEINVTDKENNIIGKKIIQEITLIRGDKLEEVIAWSFKE